MARRQPKKASAPLGVQMNVKPTLSTSFQRTQRREIRQLQRDIMQNTNRLREYLGGIKERRRKWLEHAAVPVISKMKSLAPVNTGNLRNHIGILPFERSPAVFIGPRLEKPPLYYYYIEFGTKYPKYPRKPFIRPSAVALPQAYNRMLMAMKNYTQRFISEGRR